MQGVVERYQKVGREVREDLPAWRSGLDWEEQKREEEGKGKGKGHCWEICIRGEVGWKYDSLVDYWVCGRYWKGDRRTKCVEH